MLPGWGVMSAFNPGHKHHESGPGRAVPLRMEIADGNQATQSKHSGSWTPTAPIQNQGVGCLKGQAPCFGHLFLCQGSPFQRDPWNQQLCSLLLPSKTSS